MYWKSFLKFFTWKCYWVINEIFCFNILAEINKMVQLNNFSSFLIFIYFLLKSTFQKVNIFGTKSYKSSFESWDYYKDESR